MVAHAQVALEPHDLQLSVTSHQENKPPSPDQSNAPLTYPLTPSCVVVGFTAKKSSAAPLPHQVIEPV
jgi:hypothetical protein